LRPDSTTECFLFPDLFDKSLTAKFDQHHGSSDGGAVLLKAADRRLGLSDRLVGCLEDRRDPEKIRHELSEMFRQRVYGIASGYPDCNDAGRLAQDPIFRMLLDRDPIDGERLASQPTLSRFENEVGAKALFRMGECLLDTVLQHHRRRLGRSKVRRITLDLDPSADATHGSQQLSFFNGFYDTYCYLPMLGFLRFDREDEQYLFTAVLRSGNSPDKMGALGILRRTLERLRDEFPRARIFVRMDAGFAAPEIFEFLDEQPRVDYAVAMAKNKVLERRARRLMGRARRLSRESGQSERVFGECQYAAGTWSHKRRIIIKAEVVRYPGRDPKNNPRFVVTNLRQSPRHVYEREYCARGDVENRIKELHHGLAIGRTSCTSFWANQLRVLLTAAAYVLLQELRWAARGTACARAQVTTLRERLLKVGVQVVVSVRRIVLHMPAAFPYLDCWRRVAIAFGFRGG
jgi:hypothetical protein